MNRRRRAAAILVFAIAGASAGLEAKERTNQEERVRDVIQSYRKALTDRDLDAMDGLFAADATVFENGKDEGSWKDYRAHHLGPELAGLKEFRVGSSKPKVQVTGGVALVRDHFEFGVTTTSDRSIELRAAVTYVLELREEGWRIAHMHWSSRRMPKPSE